jgi:uncharacterized protein (TIGR02145 family)
MSSTENMRYISGFEAKEDRFRRKAGGGKNYLFVIAIDQYVHCPRLYNAVGDAKEIIRILQKQYDFEPENTITLFDGEATESAMFHSLRDLARTITPADNFVFFFSGHGEFDSVFNEGYWVPVDAKEGALEDYLPNSKIRTVLNAIKSHHTFLVVDSCFSGSLFMNFKSSGVAERLEKDPSRWGLTSGRNEIVGDGEPGKHSPFAESLIYHLKNNDQPLSVSALSNKVVEDVVTQSRQTPRGEPLNVDGHRGGQFVFHPDIPKEKGMVLGAGQQPTVIEPSRGNILYNIPNTMEVEKESRCEVRVAFDKEALVEEIEITSDITIKDIRISNLMEVDLIDPGSTEQSPFSIRTITGKEQFVDLNDFTQWIFYVKPLAVGVYPLVLKVTVIEYFHGKERKREIVLEETITVVAQMPEDAPFEQSSYKEADYQFAVGTGAGEVTEEKEEKKEEKPPKREGGNRRLLGGMALGFLSIAVLILAGLFVFQSDDIVQPSPAVVADNVRTLINRGEQALELNPPDYEMARIFFEEAKTLSRQHQLPINFIDDRLAYIDDQMRPDTVEDQVADNQVDTSDQQVKPNVPITMPTAEKAWADLQDEESVEGYKDFIRSYPESSKVEQAKNRILAMEEAGNDDKTIAENQPDKENNKPDSGLENPTIKKGTVVWTNPEEGALVAFTDPRDGREYIAIGLNNRYWMRNNLSFNMVGVNCYKDSTANCTKYGRLFNWQEARYGCPPGWRIPSLQEWEDLMKYAADTTNTQAIKALGPGGKLGFDLKLGGKRSSSGAYLGLGERGYYWTSTRTANEQAFYIVVDPELKTIRVFEGDRKEEMSCRCIRDN